MGPQQLARRSDIDMNGHVNNVTYLAWALETVPQDIYDNCHLYQVSRLYSPCVGHLQCLWGGMGSDRGTPMAPATSRRRVTFTACMGELGEMCHGAAALRGLRLMI